MANRSSLGPFVLVMAALSCTFYVACGDDDIIIGNDGVGGTDGDAGGTGGRASGGRGGTGGRGGAAGLGGVGGTSPIDAGSDAAVDGGDSGPTSNG